MTNSRQKKRNGWAEQVVELSAIVALGLLLVLGIFAAPRLLAQLAASQAPDAQPPVAGGEKLGFEVASVKPDHSGTPMWGLTLPPGRFTATNVTVKRLIEWAYQDNRDSMQLRDNQIVGGAGWINTDHYDIDAKVEDALIEKEKTLPFNQWANEVRLMVQLMLAERFKLKVSFETRELPEYSLVIAKNGSKLTESSVKPPDPFGASPSTETPNPKIPLIPLMRMGRGQVAGTGVSVGNLVDMLSQQPDLNGFQVVDRTGLKDTYDFTLKWTPETPAPVGPGPDAGPPPDPTGPSIFTAIQEQLGLRLEATKGPVEIVVIEHVEEPSPN